VQAPTKYELIVNLMTAKTLGLSMPQSLLATAGELIEQARRLPGAPLGKRDSMGRMRLRGGRQFSATPSSSPRAGEPLFMQPISLLERDDKAMPLGRSPRDFLGLLFGHRLFVSQSGILAGNFFKSLLMVGFFPIQVRRNDVHFLANSIETPGQDQLDSWSAILDRSSELFERKKSYFGASCKTARLHFERVPLAIFNNPSSY